MLGYIMDGGIEEEPLYPKPHTLNLAPSKRNPHTLNLAPYTLNPHTLNPIPYTPNLQGLGSDGGSEEAIEMMKTVKETLRIRKEHPILCGQDPQVVHVDEKNYVWGVRRGEYLSIINVGSAQFGDNDDRYGVSCGDGVKAVQIFNSQAKVGFLISGFMVWGFGV